MEGRRSGVVPPGRDLAIDAVRGLAIWSMISLHFADGTKAASPTHVFPYVDGMSAFVLMSGLILGIVYRRWTERFGLRYAYDRLARRLATLYVAQVTISLVAEVACLSLSGPDFWSITVLPPEDGVAQQLWWAVTLRFLPSGGNILALYMLLMASAFLLIPVLRRRLWVLVLAGSVALYALSQAVDGDAMTLTSSPGGTPIQNWAAWQILFVPALVAGWKWTDWRIPQRLDAALPWLIGAAGVTWLALTYGRDLLDVLAAHPDLTDKLALGPVRAATAWLVVVAGYATFRRLLSWTRRDWLRPLVSTGSRSLDSYVIQAVALIAVPAWLVARPWEPRLATVIAVAVFGLCWLWAEARSRFGIDKLHRLPGLVVATAAPHSALAEPRRQPVREKVGS